MQVTMNYGLRVLIWDLKTAAIDFCKTAQTVGPHGNRAILFAV